MSRDEKTRPSRPDVPKICPVGTSRAGLQSTPPPLQLKIAGQWTVDKKLDTGQWTKNWTADSGQWTKNWTLDSGQKIVDKKIEQWTVRKKSDTGK